MLVRNRHHPPVVLYEDADARGHGNQVVSTDSVTHVDASPPPPPWKMLPDSGATMEGVLSTTQRDGGSSPRALAVEARPPQTFILKRRDDPIAGAALQAGPSDATDFMSEKPSVMPGDKVYVANYTAQDGFLHVVLPTTGEPGWVHAAHLTMPIDAESSWIYLPLHVHEASEWWLDPAEIYIQSNLSTWSALESQPDVQEWLLAPQGDNDSQVVADALRQAPCEYYSLVFPVLYSLPTGSALPEDSKEALQTHRRHHAALDYLLYGTEDTLAQETRRLQNMLDKWCRYRESPCKLGIPQMGC